MRNEHGCALILELIPQTRSFLAEMLRDAGFELVLRAETLRDALARTEAFVFGAAFVEVALHDQEGLEFIRSIRFDRDQPQRRLPIFVVAAEAHRSLIESARDAGASGFIAKPFSRASLLLQLARLRSDPRCWIESHGFAGPDRRRWQDPRYLGPERRDAGDVHAHA